MKMITTFLLAFVLCFSAKGQFSKSDISIQFGPALSFFFGNPYLKDFKPAITYSMGTTYNYHFSKYAFLQTGILFEQKGARVGVDYFDDAGNYYKTSDMIFRRNYLTVPVVCSFVTQKRVKFYLGGGFYLGYLLSAKDINSEVPGRESYASQTQPFDFGMRVGLGFYIPLHGRFLLDLGLNENLGLYDTLVHELATKNNTIGVHLGFKYDI